MIDVKDKNSKVRCSIEITDKCIYYKTLMEEEYVLLSFDSDTLIDFAKGDYILTDEFGKFIIVDINRPTSNGKGGWSYEQKFHADWERFRKRICFYDRQKGSEKEWKMTQKPEYFLDIVCENIRNAGYGRYSYEIDADLTEMKLVEFDGTNIIDALTDIAEAWDTEWWITDKVIHLGKCEYGSAVALTEDDEIASMERDDGQDASSYYTRGYFFGSTRNLPTNYRHNDDGNTVVEGVVETRLKLPSGTSYVDAWDNLADEDIVEAVVVLEDIYPRKTGTISTITTKQYTDTIENVDGTKTQEKWNAYRFTDSELAALKFSKDYVLDGEELRIVFQTGKLAGMDFAVTFNPDGVSESKSEAQVFEIVRNDDYGVNLPTDDFHPSVGDTYILYGYNTSFVYTKLVEEAEKELLEAAKEKIAEASKDKSVYTCDMNIVRCAGFKPNTTGQLVHREADEIDLDVGQLVTLYSENYFGATGYRQSRVRSFEKRLDNKFNATYTIGESSSYSRSEDLSEQVEAVTVSQKQLKNNYGSQVSVVRRYDTTAPSDNNVPSFQRAQYEFLQKHVADRATEKQTFEKGIEFGDFVAGEQGGMIDGNANAEILTAVVRKLLSSARYVNGFNGEGWRLWIDGNGLSTLELDKLIVRQVMTVFELLIERIRAVGGQIIVSAANGKIKSVTETGDGYQIYFEDSNYFVEGDLMRCQVFKGYTTTDADGKETTKGAKSYWVEVKASYADSVVVSKADFSDGNVPEAGDEVVLCGNTSNELRQNLISIAATEDGQPRIDVMDGVTTTNFTDALRARLGNLDGITDDWFPADNQPHGNGLYADNAYLRGTFLLTTGEDIKTKFEIVEGKIESAVAAVRSDFMEDKGFLNNPTFADGLNHWSYSNKTVFFLFGKRWIWGNSNVLSKKGDGASTYTDDSRKVVRIKNSSIVQKFSDFRGVPEIKTNEDGQKEPAAVYLSFFYKVVEKGTLTVGFENINNDGFVDYEPMSASVELDTTATYQQYTISGLWNSTGDFKLAFTGEIYVYMLVLSTDRIETLTNTYKTLFEQSERLVKISAAVFDKDENALKETGLFVKPEGAGLYAQDANGNVALIGVSTEVTDSEGNTKSVIMLTADNIKLEGLTTINGNFKILEDGSIEATNGTFSGTMKGVKGSFYRLSCIDYDGNEVGGITFNSSGQLVFDGDIYSQGYHSKKERSFRFYTSDVWCRGMLGHAESTMAIVKDDKIYYYTKGASKDPVSFTLESGKTTDGTTYYKVPMYGSHDDASGMPIDVVVFNCSGKYYYLFTSLDNGKRWMAINGNDDGASVYFCDIGGWHELSGGKCASCVYVNPDFLTPVPATNAIGRGVFWSGSNDLNW